ncbi:hypothetical protein GCM10028862_04420 [Luteimonas pelagia]
MRASPRTPTDHPLPHPERTAGRRHHIGDHPLDPAAVAAFDALLHEIQPDARRVTADELSQLAGWLLALPEDEARAALGERVQRIEELRALVGDADWDCDEADRARIRRLLSYLDQDEDLIPDRIPLLGLLDDVLLLELAWPAVADEAEEYRDFCAWRAGAHPVDGDGSARRAAWIRDRLDELALLRHRIEVDAHRYAESGEPARPFRIG